MSRKERVVAAIRLVIAAAGAVRRRPPAVNSRRWGFPTERLLRATAQVRSGLAERVLAGVLLAVAVAGAVLIPRLLVGPSPQHELGVGAPSVTGPAAACGSAASRDESRCARAAASHAASSSTSASRAAGHAVHASCARADSARPQDDHL